MRLLIKFHPKWNYADGRVTKHDVQGFIYNLFRTHTGKVSLKHDTKQFKFFCFNDIFPIGDFKKNEVKNLLVSSPSKTFINALDYNLNIQREYHLGGCPIAIRSVKKFDLQNKFLFKTGSPIVLYKDSKKNEYFSFKKHRDFEFFLRRLQDNAVKKYNIFFNESFQLKQQIFSDFEFRKEVVIHNSKCDKSFIHIGSTWRKIGNETTDKSLHKFFKFIMDTGLGEKNSMGFGFLNPIRGQ